MTRTSHALLVRDLFDTKAASWSAKYRPGAALASRINLFKEAIALRCAAPKKLLDFGCGTGEIAHALAQLGHDTTGCDVSIPMLDCARSAFGEAVRWVTVEPTAARFPFEDHAFDVVIASSVLEYLAEVDAALAEWSRVLRVRGILLVTVPNVRHLTRRVEKVMLKAARSRLGEYSKIIHGRLRNYVEYLRLSKNRHTRAEWCRIAGAHGFAPSPPVFTEAGPLELLAFFREDPC